MLPAIAAYAVCAGLFIGANPWEPLAQGLGIGVLLGSSVAIGLVGGRWRAVLAALVLIPLAPLTTAGEPALFVVLAMPVLFVVCASLIALGVGVRTLASRHSATAGTRAHALGAGLLAVATVLAAWGVYLANRVVDDHPAHPVLIGARNGGYRGLEVGDPAARARRLFGKPVAGDPSSAPSPLGMGPSDLSGPSSMPDWQAWRYRDLVVLVDHGRVRGYITTDRNAETGAGVGIGDSLAVARRTYSNLSCFGVTLGSDASNPSYLACEGRLPSGTAVWFGGDPIDSIWITQNYDHVAGPPIQTR